MANERARTKQKSRLNVHALEVEIAVFQSGMIFNRMRAGKIYSEPDSWLISLILKNANDKGEFNFKYSGNIYSGKVYGTCYASKESKST